MKDYLNKDERVQLLFLKKYIDQAEMIVKEWGGRDNLTKEERKSLKMAKTWGLKTFESICKRLNKTASKTFYNSITSAYINIQDRYAINMYKKKMKSDLDKCYEENRDYYALVELLMHYNCRDCTKHCRECEIYKEFEEHCIPEPTDHNNGKCRYYYTE